MMGNPAKLYQDVACYKACKVILENAGLSSDSTPNDSSVIQIASEIKNPPDTSSQEFYLNINSIKAQDGLTYIDEQLEAGYPILVGVDHTYGKAANSDGTTDHFIVIVSRGCNEDEAFCIFYEVGTSGKTNGESDDNKLYLKSDNSLQGSPKYSSTRHYVVTQVRKNILP